MALMSSGNKIAKITAYSCLAALCVSSSLFKTIFYVNCQAKGRYFDGACTYPWQDFYFKPWARAGVYFIGALASFLLKDKRKWVQLKFWWHYALYFTAWVVIVIGQIGLEQAKGAKIGDSTGNTGWTADDIRSVLWEGWVRETWGCLVVLTIFLCECVRHASIMGFISRCIFSSRWMRNFFRAILK